MSNPLRGRDNELASLHDHLARLRSGAGTSWLIEGGPGLGKSRLVRHASSAAQRCGFAVGHGVAEPGDAAVELAVLMDALFGGPEPLLERSALGDSRASREQRYWLLQDIQTLLEQSALRQPILICLDDLQWADSGTRAAIRTLPARLASLPIGWVLAFRPAEAGSDLARAAAELLRNGADRTVLECLDQAAVAEVATDVLGAAPDDSLLALAEGMRGNPFFLMELLAGLREERLVSLDAGRATLTEARLPLRVREGMRRRLARMSPAARNVAAVAASMGRRFTVGQLAAVLEVPASTLLDPVQELIRSELLAEGGQMLSFTHDLNREAVRASQPCSAVHALDRQVASALLAAGALPVEVAAQLASSAAPGDEVAITTLMRACDALGGTDPGQAADLARRALDLTTEHHPLRGPPGGPRRHPAERRRQKRGGTGLRRQCAASGAAGPAGGPGPPQHRQLVLHLPRGTRGVVPPGPRPRRGAAGPAGAPARPAVPQPRGRRSPGAGAAATQGGGRRPSSRPATAPRVSPWSWLNPRSSTPAATSRRRSPSPTPALRSGAEVGEDPRQWLARAFRCGILAVMDRFGEALAAATEGIRSAQQGRQGRALQLFEASRARQLLQLGNLADAAAALEGRFSPDDAHLVLSVLDADGVVVLGRIALHTADQRQTELTSAIARVMLRSGVPGIERHAAWLLALQAQAGGDPAQARRWLTAQGETGAPVPLPALSRSTRLTTRNWSASRWPAGTGSWRSRRRPPPSGEPRSTPGYLPSWPAPSTPVACSPGTPARWPRPSASWKPASGGSRWPPPWRIWPWPRSGLAAATRLSPPSTAPWSSTLPAGPGWDLARVRRRLRQLGIQRRLPAERRPTQGWAALTESELAVVRLVADGLTNREVAERLYVSPHTVNGHLRHAFEKLGHHLPRRPDPRRRPALRTGLATP